MAIEALACESAGAAMALALHLVARRALGTGDRADALTRGDIVGALSLSTEEMPTIDGGRLAGRASWVGPLTPRGVAIVGACHGDEIVACATPLDTSEVRVEPLATSALRGVAWGHVVFAGASSWPVGPTTGVMSGARTLIAAVALGIGKRALRESLAVAHRERGAAGEQTVQGLLADTATELDAARLLTWKAAADPRHSLSDASMAKLAASAAAQSAVVRATQVVGVDSFRHGHVIERLTQDVRAIELFAGRTEALREAVADETLPRV